MVTADTITIDLASDDIRVMRRASLEQPRVVLSTGITVRRPGLM
jgi:hypothetical protein